MITTVLNSVSQRIGNMSVRVNAAQGIVGSLLPAMPLRLVNGLSVLIARLIEAVRYWATAIYERAGTTLMAHADRRCLFDASRPKPGPGFAPAFGVSAFSG